MKKLLTFLIVVLFVSKSDLGIVSTELNKQFNILNNYINDFKINQNSAITLINYIKDPKDILTNIINNDFEKLQAELTTLEHQYYEKLLMDYKINKLELEEAIKKSKDPDLAKKQYIMEKTKLSEKEYYQVFIFPFSKIDKPTIKDDMSFSEIKDSYEQYLKESIEYLENKLDE